MTLVRYYSNFDFLTMFYETRVMRVLFVEDKGVISQVKNGLGNTLIRFHRLCEHPPLCLADVHRISCTKLLTYKGHGRSHWESEMCGFPNKPAHKMSLLRNSLIKGLLTSLIINNCTALLNVLKQFACIGKRSSANLETISSSLEKTTCGTSHKCFLKSYYRIRYEWSREYTHIS